MCDRFHKLPSEIYEEDSELIRMIAIQSMGTKREEEEVEDDGEPG